ncbi:MAG: sensor histidine kinase KdpD [Erysipelotrichaceae bacterium]|nr:sensor histidine kinase KdpD [Erysipelotrichaceae bacterium]
MAVNLNESQINKKDEHILVGLSSSPSNEKIILTAYKMAKAFNGTLTAIYVQTEDLNTMNEVDKERLQKNISIAEKLEAKIVTITGENVPFQISEYARLSNITKIVVGKSSNNKRSLIKKQSLVDQLMPLVTNIEMYIVPDSNVQYKEGKVLLKRKTIIPSFKDILFTVMLLIIETLIGYLFMKIGFTESNIIMVYIVGVLVTAILTNSQICWIASSVLSVILFNFMFTFPHFSLVAYGEGYPITFAVMLIVSLITGSISNKMKSQVKKSTETAYRTKILFDANQLIQNAKNDEEIIGVTISQIKKLLDKETFVYLSKNKKYYTKVLESLEEIKDLEEVSNETIQLVLNKNMKAGYGTEYYKNDKFAYIPLSGNKNIFGVVVVKLEQNPIEPFENSIMLSIIGECSLAIENYYNLKEKELNEILAKNEQVRANLLRAISHDLRTPLTSIIGNSDNLLVNSKSLDEELKMQMYSEIYEDSLWLLNLVENILSITKLEDGKIKLNYTTELIDDIIDEALKHINKNEIKHSIIVKRFKDLLLVNVDVRLVIQVFINLIDNAIKYTPEGSTIIISVTKNESKAIINVIDNGPGIKDKDKDRIFEMFYIGDNIIVDGRKSLGLGLSLCKSIINAHGCEIILSSNEPTGTIFTFDLPIKEVTIHE